MNSVSHYCVNCGSPLEPRVVEGRELEACPSCSFILWHDPKVVTMVVVEDERGDVVVGRRSIEPGYGLWCLPGGYVNDDEHPADSAPRMVGIGYRARLRPGEVAVAGSEMLEVATFPGTEVPELVFTSHRQAMRDWLASWEQSPVETT